MPVTDYGIKVSQKGYGVEDEDYHQVFVSSFPTLKIHQMGSTTISNSTLDVTLATHSLAYNPVFWVFADREDPTQSAANWRLASPGASQYIATSTQNLKWLGSSRGAPAGSINLYYYIFRYDLTTSYTATQISTVAGSKAAVDDYGIKVSRAGKDISSTDFRDFVIHSNTRSPIIHKTGTGTFGAGGGNVTIAHNLGYPPMFFFYGQIDSWGDSRYQMIACASDSYATADNTNLVFYAPYQMTYAYIIFADPMLLD